MPFTIVEVSGKNHTRGVKMKYYKAIIPSQKSLHPNGFFSVEYYVFAETKEEAKKAALALLRDDDYLNCQYYKSPRVEEISKETYIAKTEKQIDIDETVEIDVICALLVLFGTQDEYDEAEFADATDLLTNPDDEPDVFDRYNELREDLNRVLATQPVDLSTEAIKKLAVEMFELGKFSTKPQDNPVDNLEQKANANEDNAPCEELVAISPDVDGRSALLMDESAETLDVDEGKQPHSNLHFGLPLTVNEQIIPVAEGQFLTLETLNECLNAILPNESLIVRALPNEIYHAAEGYSSTQIRLVHEKGIEALEWYKHAPRKTAITGALTLGTAVHTALLEPERFADEYLCAPDVDLRTKDGKQTLADFEVSATERGCMVLRKDDFELVELMRDSALAYPMVADLLENGEPELSIFYRTANGVLLKIRPDWLGTLSDVPFILDVKTTDDVSEFGKSVDKYGYHLQAAYYRTVATQVFSLDIDFAFCAISKRVECGRYPVTLGLLDEEDSREGLLQVTDVIETLENGKNSLPFAVISRPWWAKQRDRKNREVSDAFGGGL